MKVGDILMIGKSKMQHKLNNMPVYYIKLAWPGAKYGFRIKNIKLQKGDKVKTPFDGEGKIIKIKDNLPWGNKVIVKITNDISPFYDKGTKEDFKYEDLIKI